MPQFAPGEQKTATVLLVAVPAGLNYEAELTLGPDPGVAVATSGRVGFVSAGGQQEVIAPVAMPPGEGTFHVYVFVYHAGEVLGIYQADEDVTIEEGVMAEGALVQRQAYQTIPSGVATVLGLDKEVYDTDNMHDLIVNNSRLTCRTSGIYLVSVQVGISGYPSDSGYRVLEIFNNSGPISRASQNAVLGDSTYMQTTVICEMWANSYVYARVKQNSGVDLNVVSDNMSSPFFMIRRIGPPSG